MIYLFTQRKAAVSACSLRNKIQIRTRPGCVINLSPHKVGGRSTQLASLQGTWLQLVLALGERLCSQECSKVNWCYFGLFAWILLGIFFPYEEMLCSLLSSPWYLLFCSGDIYVCAYVHTGYGLCYWVSTFCKDIEWGGVNAKLYFSKWKHHSRTFKAFLFFD